MFSMLCKNCSRWQFVLFHSPTPPPPPPHTHTKKSKALIFHANCLLETICMKFQSLFYGKNMRNITYLSSAEFAHGEVRVKYLHFTPVTLSFLILPAITKHHNFSTTKSHRNKNTSAWLTSIQCLQSNNKGVIYIWTKSMKQSKTDNYNNFDKHFETSI